MKLENYCFLKMAFDAKLFDYLEKSSLHTLYNARTAPVAVLV
jgi:hypothetical protein